jgi:hypothetical protein
MKTNGLSIISGLAFGSLVGLLIGLSVSEVVGAVLAVLTSLLVAFFGLKEGTSVNEFSKILVTAFCVGCICFLFIGIIVRTRNLLAPSIDYYKKELGSLHLDSEEIDRVILLKKYGISLQDQQGAALKFEENKNDRSILGSLFASGATESKTEKLVGRFQKLSCDSIENYIEKQGSSFAQFRQSLDVDVRDTAIKKRILLQLIVITYPKSHE